MSNRNQRTKDPPHLSSAVTQPTKTCAGPPSIHPLLNPLRHHPSIHPPVRLWREPVRLTDVSCHRVETSLTRAPLRAVQGPHQGLECRANSILVVDKVNRAGAVPSVSIMRQRCCSAVVFLWYSKGDAVSYIIRGQRAWMGGWGEEVGPSCPWDTHTYSNPLPQAAALLLVGVLLNLRFISKWPSKMRHHPCDNIRTFSQIMANCSNRNVKMYQCVLGLKGYPQVAKWLSGNSLWDICGQTKTFLTATKPINTCFTYTFLYPGKSNKYMYFLQITSLYCLIKASCK